MSVVWIEWTTNQWNNFKTPWKLTLYELFIGDKKQGHSWLVLILHGY